MKLQKNVFTFVVFALGVVVGFIPAYLLFGPTGSARSPITSEPVPETTNESELPISMYLLKNPIFYEWRAGVQGTIISKEKDQFTLEDDTGDRLTITSNLPDGGRFKTLFIDKSTNPTGSASASISLEAIPIGTKLRGYVWIFKSDKNSPVGGSFTVESNQ